MFPAIDVGTFRKHSWFFFPEWKNAISKPAKQTKALNDGQNLW